MVLEDWDKKEKVGVLLTSLETINPDEIAIEGDDLIDFEKVKKHPKIKEVFKKLNEMGISRAYLMDNFIMSGMVLGHLLEK